MNPNETPTTHRHVVRRSDQGLVIAGTRVTLYSLMDYVVENYPRKYIQGLFNLTTEQIEDVMDYIESHREEVSAEYQLVLRRAEALRQHYEESNQALRAQIKALPPKPGQEALRAKLQAWKDRLGIP